MKNILMFILLKMMVLSASSVRAQNCLHFAYKKSYHILYKQMLKDDRFENFSDNYLKKEVFYNKNDFRATAFLQCIPVQKINKDAINTNSSSIYIDDESTICAFLFKKNELSSVVRAFKLDYIGKNYAGDYMLGKEQISNPNILYSIILDKSKCLFFDNTLHRFCYLYDGEYYCWREDLSKFILLGNYNNIKQEYIIYNKQP